MVTEPPTVQQPTPTLKNGSPWSGLGRKLTDEEWEALKQWRKENPSERLRTGDTRADGRRFCYLNRTSCGGELWVTPEKFISFLDRTKLATKKRCNPEGYARKNSLRRKRYAASEAIRRKQKEILKKYYAENGDLLRRKQRARNRLKYMLDPREHERCLKKIRDARAKTPWLYRLKSMQSRLKRYGGLGNACVPAVLGLCKTAHEISIGTGIDHDIDHVIPISSGGCLGPENMQVMPSRVNGSKGNRAFWLSDEYLDFRDVPESLWPEGLRPHYRLMLSIFGHPLKKYSEAV